MGKKKDKLLAAQQQQQQQQTAGKPNWQQIDADPVGFLVAPEDRDSFFSKHWEQQPAVFKATPARIALLQGLCTFPSVINWLKQREKKQGPLEFGVDVNAARYKDGTRETPNGEVADASTLQALHSKEGCTLQLHQPQRFFDSCWRLLAALERQLGCLVGANAYLTPAGSQGLAPHHDDVELWVLQTSGRKRWRLYDPVNGYKLPNASSGDLEQSSLGAPCLEVELCPGDCLYMPRGTVHQAEAVEGSDSSHLTISTYQRCSYADLATHVLQVGLSVQEEGARCLPLAARCSPAPGTLLQHSLHHVLAQDSPSVSTTPDAVKGLAEALRAIAEKLEGESGAGMMTAAVHSSAIDFLLNRLPPHPKQLAPKGRAPTTSDKVWCRVAGWCYLLPCEMTGMVCEDEEEEEDANYEEGCMKLCTCLGNSREEHMITQPDDSEDESEDESSQGQDDSGDDSDEGPDSGSEHNSGEGAAAGPGPVDEKQGAAAAADGDGGDGAAAAATAGGAAAEAPAGNGSAEGADSHHGGEAKKRHKHAPGHKKAAAAAECEEGGGECHACDDACGHGHSHGSGAKGQHNPVSAMPGLMFAPRVAKVIVAFMAADSPDKAIAVRDLGLSSDAENLQFAFALWAEDLAATVPGQGGSSSKEGAKVQQHGIKAGGKRGHSGDGTAAAAAAAAADGEQVATSSGKERPVKKSKV